MKQSAFRNGAKAMLPVVPGIIPFGVIMGSVAVAQGLTIIETMLMNSIIFAGASQLVAIDLMSQNTPVLIIIFAGLVINLRFLLYSAANTDTFKKASSPLKVAGAYLLTDQSYAVVSATQFDKDSLSSKMSFFFGASIVMMFCWNTSVLIGALFGNIVPVSLSLDFAVPLSFLALLVPTLKRKSHFAVAFLSAFLSVLLFSFPLKLGLMITALISITFAGFLIKRREVRVGN